MAIREITKYGKDEILRKVCRTQLNFDDRLAQILDDMADTMYEADGVGLAAPQIGILRRYCVIDVGEGIVELINPVIMETKGEQHGQEGCLSVPGKSGQVTRPNYVKVLAYDENMEQFEIEGTELLARALCHEIDHLEGHLYVEKVEGPLMDVNYDDEEDDEE